MNGADPMNGLVRRCNAHNRHGEPCKRVPAPGFPVCNLHGAGAPQVIEAAHARLLAAADPAAAALVARLDSDDEKIILAAARDILDRVGLGADKPGTTIEVNVSVEERARTLADDLRGFLAEARVERT